jgi:ferrous iron transport protein A
MKLSELDINQTAVVKKINCNNELKQRFCSFGITKGSDIKVEAISLAKNTMSIIVEDTTIALRIDEAKTIEVELTNETN